MTVSAANFEAMRAFYADRLLGTMHRAAKEASTPAVLLERVLRDHRQVFSQATFQELQIRLWRPKFDRQVSMDNRSAFLKDLAAVADWVEPKGDFT